MLQKLKSQKFLSMVSSVLGASFALLTFAFLTRTLSKEAFGVYAIYQVIYTTYGMLRNGLVGKPLIKFLAEAEGEEARGVVLGSSWVFGLSASAVFALPFGLGMYLWYLYHPSEEFLIYAIFIPILTFGSIPNNVAGWRLNSDLRFDRLIVLNLSVQACHLAGVLWAFYHNGGIWEIMVLTVGANFVPSIIALIMGWSGIANIGKASLGKLKALFQYGRYTMGTLIGGTLLRGSDDFLIRIFLGPEAVAVYQIPNRLVNLIDIPLRALVSFSFPSLSKTNRSGDKAAFQREFEAATSFAFVLLLPMAIGTFVFADYLVVLLGGEKYADSAILLRIFSIFMAFSALDRYAGVGLDVLNRPQINMRKVILMLLVNVVGDITMLYFFESLPWVAAISIITFGVGTFLGFWFMRDIIPVRLLFWFKLGFIQIRNFVKKPVRN